MAFRNVSGILAVLLLGAACVGPVTPAAAQGEKTESRKQASLRLNGTMLPKGGGLEISETPTDGPGANLELPNATKPTKGILDKGDIITEIEGKKFTDRREFLDLMNEAYRKNDGEVRITVKDVNTGRAVVWIARPVVVRMDVPVATSSPEASSLKPLPKLPEVPTLPPAFFPTEEP